MERYTRQSRLGSRSRPVERNVPKVIHRATSTLLSAAGLAAICATACAAPVRYYETRSAGVPLKVITVDLTEPSVKITGQMAKYGAGHAEPFTQMVRRTRPTLAITGTFFSLGDHLPIGDIVIGGQLAHFGGLGTALCVTDNNEVEFVRPPTYRHQDWSKFDFVLCCGPRLVSGGTPYVEPWSEGFRDRHMLNRNGRLAVGITRGHHLVFVATREPIYLSRLARAMRALGVVDAINLDAGSSMGLYYKGHTLIRPQRWLTNLILVYEDRGRYEDARDGLAPTVEPARSAPAPARAIARDTMPVPKPLANGSGYRIVLPLHLPGKARISTVQPGRSAAP